MQKKLDPNDEIHGLKDTSVVDYWKWAYSNILSNTNRPIFAEFLVGKALDALKKPRVAWNCVDICYNNKTIEVKCSAYVQSWPQDKHPPIKYDIGKKTVDVGSEYIPKKYLFSWEEIPRNDKERFIEFLMKKYGIEWVKAAEIKQNDDGKTIMVTNGKNSLSLTLNKEETRVNLEIDGVKPFKFIVMEENGKLNIYPKDIQADRFSDCYVFCLFNYNENYKDKEKANMNILDIKFWEFYVVPTSKINEKFENNESILLSDVQEYSEKYAYDELKKRIDTVLGLELCGVADAMSAK